MPQLLHYKLQPAARLIRLMLAEYGSRFTLTEVKPWQRQDEWLKYDPAAEGPVFVVDNLPPIVGLSAITLYIEENVAPDEQGKLLVPLGIAQRAEARRLLDWCMFKLADEATRYFLAEKLIKRDTGAAPDPAVLRAARSNLGEHLHYFTYLLVARRWLAGDAMTIADFALAAHLSVIDYFADMPWENAPEVKDWYQRIKSRP
ncbi:MAG: glutathione S-transferase family protein, partial [Alphaproteobacteria bacterium]|nr:glutathione S-transferase family protein [Alphaproteobacteria bacterium]